MKLTKAESAPIDGAESRSPKTPQGRAISSQNATSHGFTSRTLVLRNEDPDQFWELLNSYFDLLKPANQLEVDVVSDIVAARWRLRRMKRYKTAIARNQGAAAGSAVAGLSNGFAAIHRMELSLKRTYRGALEDFRRLRASPISSPKILES